MLVVKVRVLGVVPDGGVRGEGPQSGPVDGHAVENRLTGRSLGILGVADHGVKVLLGGLGVSPQIGPAQVVGSVRLAGGLDGLVEADAVHGLGLVLQVIHAGALGGNGHLVQGLDVRPVQQDLVIGGPVGTLGHGLGHVGQIDDPGKSCLGRNAYGHHGRQQRGQDLGFLHENHSLWLIPTAYRISPSNSTTMGNQRETGFSLLSHCKIRHFSV